MKDPLNNVTRFEYDENKNITSSTDPFENKINFSYDYTGNLIAIEDSKGTTTQMAYDEPGNITSVTNGLNQTTSMTYNVAGKVTSITDPLNRTVTMDYEPIVGCGPCRGMGYIKLKSITDPEGNQTKMEYDEVGNLIKTTDPLNNSVFYEYNAHKQVTKITDSKGRFVRYNYDAIGNPIELIDKKGNSTTYEYNTLNRVTLITYATGATKRLFYDAVGNLTKEIDAFNKETRYVYNINDRVIKSVDALGNTTEVEYNVLGEVTSVKDANGVMTSFVYEKGMRLKKVVDALNGEISYEYNELNDVSSITDQLERKVTYQYDKLSRLLNIISDMNKNRAFEYDEAGQLVTQTDPKGQQTNFEYTPAGRISHVSYADGREIFYEYNAIGNRTKMTDWTGETVYSYDRYGRLIKINSPDNKSVSYTYNDFDELVSITLTPDSIRQTFTWAYEYDNYGRVTKIKDPHNNSTRFTYDIVGRIVETTYPNRTKKAFSYDAINNLTSLIYSTRNNVTDYFKFTYDSVGNRLSMDEMDGVTTYTYNDKYELTNAEKYRHQKYWRAIDRLYGLINKSKSPKKEAILERLTAVTNSLRKEFSISYTYDSVGNRTSKTVDAMSNINELSNGVYSYIHDNDNRLIKEIFSKNVPGWAKGWHKKNHQEITDFSYDLNGNLLREIKGNQVSRFSYDASDNMVMSEVHGKKPVAFSFNGDNQRVARFFRNNRQIRSAKSKKNCKAGKDDDESDGEWLLKNWQLDTGYTYSGAEVLAEFDSKDKISSSYTTGLGIDDHISVTQYKGKRRADTYYYVSDALGSVKKIQDHRGKTVNSYNYTPYGESYSVKEKINQPYRYTGRRWDPNVGKLWYRSRHYDAGRGRFGQADKWNNSVMNPVGYSAYGYVRGNPVRFVDPMGYVLSLSSEAATSFTGIENISSAIIYAINKTQKENSEVVEKVDMFSVTMALYFYKIYTNELQKVLTNDIKYSVIIESQNVLNDRYDKKNWLSALFSKKINEANGYFDATTNTISISSYYTTENAPDPYDYVKVLIHEAGHAALKQMSLIYNDLNIIEFSFVDSIAERLLEHTKDYLEKNCKGSSKE